jgi:hypothetical protein
MAERTGMAGIENQLDDSDSVDGWSRQFIDDLVAANRFKTFLVAQGANVSPHVLEQLGEMSERFAPEIDDFIWSERKRNPLPIPLRWVARGRFE